MRSDMHALALAPPIFSQNARRVAGARVRYYEDCSRVLGAVCVAAESVPFEHRASG